MAESTYYRSAQLRRYKDGWRGQLKYVDENGNWKSVTKVLNTKQAKTDTDRARESALKRAHAELEEWREEMEEKAKLPDVDESTTVAGLVKKYVDLKDKDPDISRATINGYRNLERHIRIAFGKTPYRDIKPLKVREWFKDFYAETPTTAKKTLILLKSVYKDATDNLDLFDKNPIRGVQLPKEKKTKAKKNALTSEDRSRLMAYLDIAAPTTGTLGIKMALQTGMREGEICGLQWKNVNLTDATICIEQAVGRDGGKTYLKGPKSEDSERVIPIPEDLLADLKIRKAQMESECLQVGIPFDEDKLFVLGNVEGGYKQPNKLWNEWHTIATQLGLEGVNHKTPTFHDLRHEYASNAAAAGSTPSSLQENMGHSDARTTLNLYIKTNMEDQRKTAENASRVLRETVREAEIVELRPTGTEG